MSDDVYLAEYDALRAEILQRTQIGNGLVTLEIAALGAGLSTFSTVPEVLIGLAAVSSILWLLWIDQASQVWKIAFYMAQHLAPRLQERAPGALGWEQFLRQFDQGGSAGRAVTARINLYMTLVFGGVPPLLLIGYAVNTDTWTGSEGAFRIVALVAGTGLWLFAASVYRNFRTAIANLDRTIADRTIADRATEAADAPEEAPRDAPAAPDDLRP